MTIHTRLVGGDVFSGAGGMSIGFEQAGINVAFGIDSDPIAAETFARNFPHSRALLHDVRSLSGSRIRQETGLGERQLDLLFGGSPCGGFSLIGRRRRDDPRNLLLLEFSRLVAELKPRYFVLENVKGALIGEARNVIADFLIAVRAAGYRVVLPIRSLNASEYGVPQNRTRVFILGYIKHLQKPSYPISQTHISANGSHPTVWDAIGDLPDINNIEDLVHSDTFVGALGDPSPYAATLRGERKDSRDLSIPREHRNGSLTGCIRTAHSVQTVRRFQRTKPGTREPISRYIRLTKDGLAPTLRSGSDGLHGAFTAPRPIHPIHARCITVREAARLHSYPDWFQFHPTKWHGCRQVGNSVPPLLARAVATAIIQAIEESEGE